MRYEICKSFVVVLILSDCQLLPTNHLLRIPCSFVSSELNGQPPMEEPCLLGIFYPLLQKDYFICIMSFLPLRPPHAMLEDDVKKAKCENQNLR